MLSFGTLLGLGIVGIVVYSIGSYFRDPKELRRFPAPSIFASLSPFWLSYQVSTGQRFKRVHEAHQKWGPAVRIAFDHVSFTHPQAYKEIYGHGSPNLKGDFFNHAAEGNPSISLTTNKAEHTRKRKALSHVFSARQITVMEPRVMKILCKLCRDIHLKSQGRQISDGDEYPSTEAVFDVRPWLNMFAYDAITSMVWSNTYGFLDRGNDLCPSQDGTGEIEQVHAMDSFHSISTFNAIYAAMPKHWYELAKMLLANTHNKKAGPRFGGMARYQVCRRLESVPDEPDLFSNLPSKPSAKWPIAMPISELVAESATMLDAGNDTTQTSLTNCVYRLAKHPDKQEKLYDALAKALPLGNQSTPVFKYSEDLQNIPYLRAVLEESFRCQPPLASGLPRKVVEPITVAGYVIHPGTTVSVPLYSLHRDETLFRDASAFIPERWLGDDDPDRNGYITDPEEHKNLKDYCLPFSIGGRACIGRNLAYMEISMVITALVLGFEWTLAEPEKEMEMIERFNCNPKALRIQARAREGIKWAEWKA